MRAHPCGYDVFKYMTTDGTKVVAKTVNLHVFIHATCRCWSLIHSKLYLWSVHVDLLMQQMHISQITYSAIVLK